ncbi:MAG TPA: ScyD/ScyE family protein [Blastocatellia bacterium]|nr:ScyD/ScyE family protein [Blastocatellia bacterium]
MSSKKTILFTTVIALTIMLAGIDGFAQCSTTVVAGLRAPVKSVLSPGGSLIVAEAGNGPNTGRISIIDQSGTRRTLIDALPSGISPEGISGPSGVDLKGRTLYVTIGQGDSVIAGPIPGATQLPNPAPSSTLFASVISIRFSVNVEAMTEGFTLTAAQQTELKNGGRRTLSAANGQSLTLEVVADFRDFNFENFPGVSGNVRASNPFGVAVNGNTLFVSDAGQNLIRQVDIRTGDTTTLARFAPGRNPLPFGPPFSDAVPDNVRLFGKQLLVPLLTGFPFAPGVSEIRKVNRVNNSQSTFIGGLTTAIDVLPIKVMGQDQFFTLEFSANLAANPLPPGRLKLFAGATAQPVTLADCLISPSSMSFDAQTRKMFITETFTGRVVSVQVP